MTHQTQANFFTVKFTVNGHVQGVFFRKHTQSAAQSLGLTGWCRNTPAGTVEGEFECSLDEREKAMEFKYWLRYVGSSKSVIEGVEFEEERCSYERRFDRFKVVR